MSRMLHGCLGVIRCFYTTLIRFCEGESFIHAVTRSHTSVKIFEIIRFYVYIYLLLFGHSVVPNSLQPRGLQPGFPVPHWLWSLLKLMFTELVMPSNHLILCHPLLLVPLSFPAPGSFPVSQFFASCSQSTRASALALVLPMNIQGWFPLALTGLISLLSKGLSYKYSQTLDLIITYSNSWPQYLKTLN